MLILAKTALATMLGFIFAIICGLIIIPVLKKINFRQHVSETEHQRRKVIKLVRETRQIKDTRKKKELQQWEE